MPEHLQPLRWLSIVQLGFSCPTRHLHGCLLYLPLNHQLHQSVLQKHRWHDSSLHRRLDSHHLLWDMLELQHHHLSGKWLECPQNVYIISLSRIQWAKYTENAMIQKHIPLVDVFGFMQLLKLYYDLCCTLKYWSTFQNGTHAHQRWWKLEADSDIIVT